MKTKHKWLILIPGAIIAAFVLGVTVGSAMGGTELLVKQLEPSETAHDVVHYPWRDVLRDAVVDSHGLRGPYDWRKVTDIEYAALPKNTIVYAAYRYEGAQWWASFQFDGKKWAVVEKHRIVSSLNFVDSG